LEGSCNSLEDRKRGGGWFWGVVGERLGGTQAEEVAEEDLVGELIVEELVGERKSCLDIGENKEEVDGV
jgi:hypothetical protein